jgi:hypothetical protein
MWKILRLAIEAMGIVVGILVLIDGVLLANILRKQE